MNIGKNRICFFNSFLADKFKTSAEYVMHAPIKKDFCINFDSPWEKDAAFPNIIFDDGKWRMYYMAGIRIDMERIAKVSAEDPENLKHVVDETIAEGFKICYAESKDGIHWVKPVLNICQFRDSTENNIILKKAVEFFVMKDSNPSCPQKEKFKAIYNSDNKLYCMFSADGIRFEEGGLISVNGGLYDTLNTVSYDAFNDRYVAYVRGMHRPDQTEYPDCEDKDKLRQIIFPDYDTEEEYRKNEPKRDIRVMYSKDFKKWSRPERIYIQGEDGLKQLYTNCISVYPRAPQYYIGLPNRYNEARAWDKNYGNLCGNKERVLRRKISPRYGAALTDCLFISSIDGKTWEKSDGAYVRVGHERRDGWVYGDCYFAPSLVETENENYGYKEYSLYCIEGLWGFNCRLMRYTLRLDGFASYHAGEQEKIYTTKPFVFNGSKLKMNLSTSVFGSVVVTLADEAGNEVTSAEIFGDDTDKEIWFEDEKAVGKMSGKTVVMTVRLREADIYSFIFN